MPAESLSLDEMVWFTATRGGPVRCMARSDVTPDIAWALQTGDLTRVLPDGSPWQGSPLPGPPLPEEMTISTIRGFRFWMVSAGGLLMSQNNFIWPPGEWARALCAVCRGPGLKTPSLDRCQDYGYGCGLYAADMPYPDVQRTLWGAVEAKGRIVSHDRGFRAEFMRVVALAEPDPFAPFIFGGSYGLSGSHGFMINGTLVVNSGNSTWAPAGGAVVTTAQFGSIGGNISVDPAADSERAKAAAALYGVPLVPAATLIAAHLDAQQGDAG